MEVEKLKKVKKKVFIIFFIIIILFFSIYTYKTYTFKSQNLWWDETVYFSLAKSFLEKKSLVISINEYINENIEAFRSPLFPIISSILLFLFKSIKAVYYFNYIIMILFLILMFLFFKNKKNVFISLTTIITFLSLKTIFITTKALAEPLELLFVILFFYILFFKKEYEYFIPIILILSFLTKYSLIILTVTYIFYIFLEYKYAYNYNYDYSYKYNFKTIKNKRIKDKKIKEYLKEKINYKFKITIIIAITILLLWFYHNYYFYHDILGSLKENAKILNYNYKKTPFLYYFEILKEKTKYFYYTIILGFLLFLKDTIFTKNKLEKIQNYTIIFFVTFFFLSLSIIYEKNYRYLFPIIIFLSYFTSYFILTILKNIKVVLKKIIIKEYKIKNKNKREEEKEKKKNNKKNKKIKENKKSIIVFTIMTILQIIVLIILIIQAYNNIVYETKIAYENKKDRYNFKKIAEYLVNNTEKNESIMSLYRQPWYYYTNRNITWYPKQPNMLPEYITKYNVKYIILEKNIIPQFSWSESFLEKHNYSLPVYNETYGDYYFKKVLEEKNKEKNVTIKVYKVYKVNVIG